MSINTILNGNGINVPLFRKLEELADKGGPTRFKKATEKVAKKTAKKAEKSAKTAEKKADKASKKSAKTAEKEAA